MRRFDTIANGAKVQVFEPINDSREQPLYTSAFDRTITAAKAGETWHFAVKCDNQAQAEFVVERMKERDDLGPAYIGIGCPVPAQVVPFRLLGRRWLQDWRETCDRIEAREGASGSLYIAIITDGTTVGEERIPANRDDKDERLSMVRSLYPHHHLFDYR